MKNNVTGPVFFINLLLLMLLLSCARKQELEQSYAEIFEQSFFEANYTWDELITLGEREKRVNFYYIAISNGINQWLQNTIKPKFENEYGIVLNLYAIDSIDILITTMLNEKDAMRNREQTNKEDNVDVFWISEDEYYKFEYHNMFFGPFANKLLNSKYFIWDDMEYESNIVASGIKIDYNAMPWHTGVFTTYINRNYVDELEQPASYLDLYGWLKQNSGKFTYTKIPDSNGSAFVESVIYDFNPTDIPVTHFQKPVETFPIQIIVGMISQGFQFLKLLNPYLWKEGTTYPLSAYENHNLYQSNQVYIMSLYDTFGIIDKIAGLYKTIPTAQTNFSNKGAISQKSYLSISSNSTHPAASLLLINELSSTYMQISKLENTGLGIGIDYKTLNKFEQTRVDLAYARTLFNTDAELANNIEPDIDKRTLERFGNRVVQDNTKNSNIDEMDKTFAIQNTVSNMHISWKKLLNAIWLEYIAEETKKPFILVVKEVYDLVINNEYISN